MYKRTLIIYLMLLQFGCAAPQKKHQDNLIIKDCSGNKVDGVLNRELKLCEAKAPRYPESAYHRGIKGMCITTFDVNLEGRIENASVQCSPQGYFEKPALASKKYYRYLSAVKDGKPVPSKNVTRKDYFY